MNSLKTADEKGANYRCLAYVDASSFQLAERWLRRLRGKVRVLLVCDREIEVEAREFALRFIEVEELVLTPCNEESDMKRFEDTVSEFDDRGSLVWIGAFEQRPLEFLSGSCKPDISALYSRMYRFWRAGVRRVELHSYGGVRTLDLPWFLDAFVGKGAGNRCFIVGNGPSLNAIDMSLLKDEVTFGSNRCYLGYEKWGFACTYWGLMDRLQVEAYGPEYEANVPAETVKFFPFEYLNLLEFENACPVNFKYDGRLPCRFSGSARELYLGFTVTHMLMQVAAAMGFETMYLIGCDHRYDLGDGSGKRTVGTKGAAVWAARDARSSTHFTDEYTAGGEKVFITPKPSKIEAGFESARIWSENHRVRILNATPNSGLDVFPRIEFESIFDK